QLEPYCTVLIDKSRTRIFFLDLGGVEERYDIYGVVPGRHDQGGWAQARYQRHHDDHVMHHLKDTADELLRLRQEEDLHRLIVAGTEELVSQFTDYLHPYLKNSLVATLPLEMTASPKEVQEQVLAVVEDLNKREEANLIQKLRGEAFSGNLGAIGLEDTLHAWQAGQVLTLLINEGFHAPGRRCSRCGSLTVREGSCPYCDQTLETLQDVVEELIKRAFLGNTEIKLIAGENREALAEMGSIGALLRFTA
ncbi:MAG: Vms1/Ankzf1 family peptidyl-tRNA hydrolase, partial [Anaerolineae bacterium]